MIFGMDHESSRTDIAMIDQGFKPEKQVTVGDDVFIGARVIILPGVSIGSGAIIGAGAVVSKDIPDWAVAVGNPARAIRYRNADPRRKQAQPARPNPLAPGLLFD